MMTLPGADMHLFRMSAIFRRDGSSLPIGYPSGTGSRPTRLAIRLDDRRVEKPFAKNDLVLKRKGIAPIGSSMSLWPFFMNFRGP